VLTFNSELVEEKKPLHLPVRALAGTGFSNFRHESRISCKAIGSNAVQHLKER